MEKLRPTYDLSAIKAAIGSPETLAITVTAFRDALALGFDRNDIVDVVHSVGPGMFYKSMTTHVDHRVWQDVYHVPVDGLVIYLKFQANVVTQFSIVSFKER